MPVDPNQAKAIFCAALEKDSPEERVAFMKVACAGDAELGQRVEALLRAHEARGGVREPPGSGPEAGGTSDRIAAAAVEAAADVKGTTGYRPAEGGGAVIGPYKLLQKLGEGGMGAVFLAEQRHPVARKVALKIIKAGLDSAPVVARFAAERQALALMDHPNIARVLDAGATDAGRPYFVMELVKGIPITRYCDQEHLTPQERLRLFIPVCQAVQHPHQKGIIHRDLKPSNVLVALYDGRAVPKVIDFGVAKATQQKLTEATLFTEVGQMVGTLEYMAPEQAELNNLDIDTRADVYSLGVLLYELLTGAPPFTATQLRSAAFTEMLRIIREVEPPKPSTRLSSSEELPSIAAKRKLEPARLTKLLAGDLDWIVMKALEKDRGRRYETANGFAHDVQRYLADEPVEACPPSAGYRLKKFLRRNKGPVLAATLVLAALLAGTVGATWGLVRALRAERATRDEQTKTQEALESLTAEQAKTSTALAAERQAKTRTREALETLTDTVVATAFARGETLGEEDRKFLLKVLDFYQGVAKAEGNLPEARRFQAEGYRRVMKLLGALGRRQEALAANQEALRLAEDLAREFPDNPADQRLLALQLQNVAAALMGGPKAAEADAMFTRALGIFDKLIAAEPNNAEYLSLRGLTRYNLGRRSRGAARNEPAIVWFQGAANDLEAAARLEPAVPLHRVRLADTCTEWSRSLRAVGRLQEAVERYGRCPPLYEQLVAEFPAEREYRHKLSYSWKNMGSQQFAQGNYTLAVESIRKARTALEDLGTEFPNQRQYRADAAGCLQFSAGALNLLNRRDEAVAECEQAIAIFRSLCTQDAANEAYHLSLGQGYLTLAMIQDERKKPREAEAAARQGVDTLRSLVQTNPSPQGLYCLEHCLSHQGNARVALGKPAEALPLLREAAAIADRQRAEHPTVTAYQPAPHATHWALADCLVAMDDLPGAIDEFRKARAVSDVARAPAWHRGRRIQLSGLLVRARRVDEAHAELKAVADELTAIREPPAAAIDEWKKLGEACGQAGAADRAVAAFDRWKQLRLAAVENAHPPRTEFRELLNADLPALEKWVKELPPGWRPTAINAHAQADPPRFNAVAAPGYPAGPVEMSNVEQSDVLKELDRRYKAGFQPPWRSCTFFENGMPRRLDVFVKDPIPGWEGHAVVRGDTSFLNWKKKENKVPVDIHHQSTPGKPGVDLGVQLGPSKGRDWELCWDLSPDQLREAAARTQTRGWRPVTIDVIAEGARLRYSVVFAENPLGTGWKFFADLAGAEYDQSAAAWKAAGLRPLAVLSHGTAAEPRYTGFWVAADGDRREAVAAATANILKVYGAAVRPYDIPKAVAAFREWGALSPSEDDPLSYLAVTLGERGRRADWDEAVALFRELQRRRGDQWNAYLSIALAMSGKADEAWALKSKSGVTLEGILLLELGGKPEEARKQLAAQLAKACDTANVGEAHLLARTAGLVPAEDRDWAAVLRLAEIAKSRTAAGPGNQFPYALAKLRTGNCEEALHAAEKTAELAPTWATGSVQLVRAIACHRLKRFDEARRLYEAALKGHEPLWNSNYGYHFPEYQLLRREAEGLIHPGK